MISAGYYHWAAVLRNGRLKATGGNDCGQCRLPERDARDVCCGGFHTVIHKLDGTAVASGLNLHGQCTLPTWPPDEKYKQVHAGYTHTGLLHLDGNQKAKQHNRNRKAPDLLILCRLHYYIGQVVCPCVPYTLTPTSLQMCCLFRPRDVGRP